jgi:putative hydrolase of the HAD superfamily
VSAGELPCAVLLDVGHALLFPDGARVAALLRAQLGVEASPTACVDAFARVIHGRDTLAEGAVVDDAWFARQWGAALGIEPHRLPAVTALLASLEGADPSYWTQCAPDAHAVLAALRERGVITAAVSNADGRLERDLVQADLWRLFDVVLDSELVGARKPEPAMFEAALRLVGAPAARCWFVGDDERNDVTPTVRLGFGAVFHLDRLGLYGRADGFVRVRQLGELLAFLPGPVSEQR